MHLRNFVKEVEDRYAVILYLISHMVVYDYVDDGSSACKYNKYIKKCRIIIGIKMLKKINRKEKKEYTDAKKCKYVKLCTSFIHTRKRH